MIAAATLALLSGLTIKSDSACPSGRAIEAAFVALGANDLNGSVDVRVTPTQLHVLWDLVEIPAGTEPPVGTSHHRVFTPESSCEARADLAAAVVFAWHNAERLTTDVVAPAAGRESVAPVVASALASPLNAKTPRSGPTWTAGGGLGAVIAGADIAPELELTIERTRIRNAWGLRFHVIAASPSRDVMGPGDARWMRPAAGLDAFYSFRTFDLGMGASGVLTLAWGDGFTHDRFNAEPTFAIGASGRWRIMTSEKLWIEARCDAFPKQSTFVDANTGTITRVLPSWQAGLSLGTSFRL